jgi:hypothetical protein
MYMLMIKITMCNFGQMKQNLSKLHPVQIWAC